MTVQTAVRIAPLRPDFLDRARTEHLDDLGQPVKRLVAKGGEPCRDALRRAKPGEALILASYSPFSKPGPYHEYGPIFILENPDPQPPTLDELPSAGAPGDYLREQFAVRAYSAEEEIADAALIRAHELDETVARFLDSPDVAFLHVRFPVYGCFALRIDRP